MRIPLTAMVWFVAALLVGALLTACAGPGAGARDGVEYDERLDLGVPGAVLETVEGVRAYPACGNEPITYDGTTWYPFEPANLDDFPTVVALAWTGGGGFAGGTMRGLLPAVVAPGPGDDVGTLLIYEGGFAHWASDSGDLETWLTDQRLEYWWVC